MSYFLWIEDFEGGHPKITSSYVLSSILDENALPDTVRQLKTHLKTQGIFLETNMQDSLNFIRNRLPEIDYIILDIDFPAIDKNNEINQDVLALLKNFEDYSPLENENDNVAQLQNKCDRLKEIAGFYLYTELIFELGFPKSHILFCSNHGENTKTIQKAFKDAKIALPPIYQKSDVAVKEWVKNGYDNPYSRLRRGIIEGCQYLKTLTETEFRFNEFIKEEDKEIGLMDLFNYISVLETLLPLQEPKNKEYFYKLFVRTLAHEWEAAEPKKLNNQNELFSFSWIMKMSRNWLAHSKIFEKLTAQDVAYLFMVNIRAMFDLGNKLVGYEKILLNLFEPISATDLKAKIGNDFKDRKLPLVENYAQVLKATGNTYQAINFHDALSNLQKYKINENEPEFFVKGLYQTFWFLTSNGGVFIPSEEQVKKFSVLNYQFRYFDYHKKDTEDYLFELARHIYNRSFS